MTEHHAPGVYFGMPEDEYHADPALSASAVRALMISALTYWCDFLDPNREEDDSDTPARIKGKAMHKYVLEGRDAFDAGFVTQPDPDDYPNHARGAAALKTICKDYGLKQSGTIAEMVERIREKDDCIPLWPEVEAEFLETVKGRTVLAPDVGKQIIRTGELVHAHPSVRRAVNGGFPEVSIFWTDEDGLRWKCRIDYLKRKAAIDMKTFTNMFDKPLATAVAHAVAQHRYHVQASVYMDGLAAARSIPVADWISADNGKTSPPSIAWIEDFQKQTPAFVFLFVESGHVPNVALREFRQYTTDGVETLAYQSAAAAVGQAVRTYQEHMERYGPAEPWASDAPVLPFHDEEFPLYMTE